MFQRNPSIEEAPLQNELMLFNPTSAQFFLLNPTMAYIWRNCDDKNVDALIAGVVDSFDGVDPGAAAGDVHRALDELLSAGLLVDGTKGNA